MSMRGTFYLGALRPDLWAVLSLAAVLIPFCAADAQESPAKHQDNSQKESAERARRDAHHRADDARIAEMDKKLDQLLKANEARGTHHQADDARIAEMDKKLDQLLKANEAREAHHRTDDAHHRSDAIHHQADDVRIAELSKKLDQLLKEVKELRQERRSPASR